MDTNTNESMNANTNAVSSKREICFCKSNRIILKPLITVRIMWVIIKPKIASVNKLWKKYGCGLERMAK
jgi:hypothetical protein